MMLAGQPRLLIVDDDAAVCGIVERAGTSVGFSTASLTDSTRFLEKIRDLEPTVLITDLRMPGLDGVQLLERLAQEGCRARIFVMSGMDMRSLNTARRLGRSLGLDVAGVVQKPVRRADLQLLLKPYASVPVAPEELEAAILSGELTLAYQPKATRRDGGWIVDTAEALARWRSPGRGVVMPDDFIPVAEECGLAISLADQVLEMAVQQLAAWMERGVDLKLAVNVSAHLIRDAGFPDRLRRLLDEHSVPGSRLILELTESAAMADPVKAMDIFLRLRLCDVGLSIDDFGTAYSSLRHLYMLPFEELKIDRTFIQLIPEDEEAIAIVRATIQMAHALDMAVCAEGVETREALAFLESLGCDRAQGYLVARPLAAGKLEALAGPWAPPGGGGEEASS